MHKVFLMRPSRAYWGEVVREPTYCFSAARTSGSRGVLGPKPPVMAAICLTLVPRGILVVISVGSDDGSKRRNQE